MSDPTLYFEGPKVSDHRAVSSLTERSQREDESDNKLHTFDQQLEKVYNGSM